MQRKGYPGFGHVLVHTKSFAGEVLSDDRMHNGIITLSSVNENGAMINQGDALFWFMAKGRDNAYV